MSQITRPITITTATPVNLLAALRAAGTAQVQTISIATAALAGGAGKTIQVGGLIGISGTDFGATATRNQVLTWLQTNAALVNLPHKPVPVFSASATNDILITSPVANGNSLPLATSTDSNFSAVLTTPGMAGYNGSPLASLLNIYNAHASGIVYIHATDDGLQISTTAANGWPIGAAGTASAAPTFQYSRDGSSDAPLDLGSVWLYTTANMNVAVMVVG